MNIKDTITVVNQMQADHIIGCYAIGGAVGATFYLEPSATFDVDIFVSFENVAGGSPLSLSPIYDYLTARGHKTEKEYIIINGWPVRFLAPTNALVEEALEQAAETKIDEIPTRVMSAEHLVAIALQTGRAKDFARILQFIEAAALDSKKLDHILKRHGLVEKWNDFEYKFLGKSK